MHWGSKYPSHTLGICFELWTCILQITAWVSYNKIQILESYHMKRTRTYRHHVRTRFISISLRWKAVCMSLKSKTIFPFGPPNVLGGSVLVWFVYLSGEHASTNHETFSFQVVGAGCPSLVGRDCLFHRFSGNPWTIWYHQHLDTSLPVAGCSWGPHRMLGLLLTWFLGLN